MTGLALPDRELLDNGPGVIGDVGHAQRQQVAGAQHGVDGRVEQGEVAQRGDGLALQPARFGRRRRPGSFARAGPMLRAQNCADDVGLVGGKWRHLTDRLPLVPGRIFYFGFRVPVVRRSSAPTFATSDRRGVVKQWPAVIRHPLDWLILGRVNGRVAGLEEITLVSYFCNERMSYCCRATLT